SHVAHRPLGFRLCLQPANSTKFVERRLMTFRARITLHEIEPLDGHVKLRVVRVIEQHKLATLRRSDRWRWLGRPEIESNQSAKSRDAMIDVHHIVVDFEIAKI